MKAEPKDTYKYQVKMGRKVVDRGCTSVLDRREAEIQERYPEARLQLIGRRTTREAALRWVRLGGKRPYVKQRRRPSGQPRDAGKCKRADKESTYNTLCHM